MKTITEVFPAHEIEINSQEWLAKVCDKVNQLLEMPCNAEVNQWYGIIRAKHVAVYWQCCEDDGLEPKVESFFL